MKKHKSPEQKANEIIAIMEAAGLSYDDMLEVIQMTKNKLKGNVSMDGKLGFDYC